MKEKRAGASGGGAGILAAANILCRALGFLFKIPLTNLIGSEGMGYFGFASQVFGVASFASCGGLPSVFSREIAALNAVGRPTLPALKAVSPVFLITGAVSSVAMGLLAGPVCSLAGVSEARLGVIALAPGVFFVSAESLYRAYFQGRSMLGPGALAQVCEAVGKLLTGTLAAWLMFQKKCPPSAVAGGAALGVTLGAAVAAGVLRLRLIREGRTERTRSEQGLVGRMLREALLLTLGSGIMSVLGALDAAVILNRLGSLGLDRSSVASVYGIYTGYAVTVYALPFAVTGAITSWVCPAAAGAYALGDGAMLREKLCTALRLSGCVGAFAAFCYVLMPEELLKIFFSRSEAAEAAPLLCALGASVFLGPVCSVLSSALQAMGKLRVPVISAVAGGCVRLGMNYVLVGMPRVGMLGAPISAAVSSLLGLCACFLCLVRVLGSMGEGPGFIGVLAKPFVCGLGGAFFAAELCRGLSPFLGGRLSAGTGVLGGVLVLLALALLTGTVSGKELRVFRSK